MTVNSITPDLMVEDIEETVAWYESVLDAEVVATLPAEAASGYFWAQVSIDGIQLMLQERDSLEEKLPVLEGESTGGTVPLYIDVDDAERRHAALEESDVNVVKQPHETEFGWRQFAVTDPNGYVLWFGEKLETERTENIGHYERTYYRHQIDESSRESAEHRPRRAAGGEHWG
ncbi:VOC family protein [Halobellus ruber]|uniref:VOC family protein n=1 Tax=Halobellus ruber TaxID=2761102 RepID=A0A7J9SF83_9EURY|nr:VOC family protein [Halobellus ruber]MBB6644769.1 VOC family protein [Halobellus ruber]